MAFWENLTGLFGKGKPAPGHRGEVALAVCGLEGCDAASLRGLRPGVELALTMSRGRVAVMLKGRPAGYLPEGDAGRVAALLEQGTELGCRMVSAGDENNPARVRISILM
ncbi:hypothetical protein [Fundidesulfovibrio terrae]|uniref:hypothetical protein n=1 Tax=Fundidesulfovibrio terrae TaxID=2922866 RepID=UPI001FAF4D5F|nr:hypothetical protein [Fundidesulfovibrio terrae]